MKNMTQFFISFLIIFSLVGCTSFSPVNMTTSELQKQISAGNVINSHNKVKLQTSSGKSHELIVTRVTSTHVHSENKSIPINTIISVKKSGTNHTKTAGLTVIVLVAVALTVAYKVVGDVTDDILE
jgi:hypothetical protein